MRDAPYMDMPESDSFSLKPIVYTALAAAACFIINSADERAKENQRDINFMYQSAQEQRELRAKFAMPPISGTVISEKNTPSTYLLLAQNKDGKQFAVEVTDSFNMTRSALEMIVNPGDTVSFPPSDVRQSTYDASFSEISGETSKESMGADYHKKSADRITVGPRGAN